MSMPLPLVTGANRGVGRALVDQLARRGPVIGTHRGGAPDATDNITWQTLDVTAPDSHCSLAGTLAGQPLSHLVCNAGVYLDKGHAIDTGYGADLWAQTFAANVTGVFLTIQALLPNLRACPGSKIAIISSQMASQTRAPGNGLIYRASKAAALNLGRNLSSELASEGIAVGIYHPGWVRTEMGGGGADLSAEQAAAGLVDRLDALSMDTTGCFLTWDGREHPY